MHILRLHYFFLTKKKVGLARRISTLVSSTAASGTCNSRALRAQAEEDAGWHHGHTAAAACTPASGRQAPASFWGFFWESVGFPLRFSRKQELNRAPHPRRRFWRTEVLSSRHEISVRAGLSAVLCAERRCGPGYGDARHSWARMVQVHCSVESEGA